MQKEKRNNLTENDSKNLHLKSDDVHKFLKSLKYSNL